MLPDSAAVTVRIGKSKDGSGSRGLKGKSRSGSKEINRGSDTDTVQRT